MSIEVSQRRGFTGTCALDMHSSRSVRFLFWDLMNVWGRVCIHSWINEGVEMFPRWLRSKRKESGVHTDYTSDNKKAHLCLCAYTLFYLWVLCLWLLILAWRDVRLLRIFCFFIALFLTLNTFIWFIQKMQIFSFMSALTQHVLQ